MTHEEVIKKLMVLMKVLNPITLYTLITLGIIATSLGFTLIIAEMDDICEELRKINGDKE